MMTLSRKKDFSNILNREITLNTKHAVIFAMYDKQGIIQQNVIDYLTELRKYTDLIILVSDCEILESELCKIENLVDIYKFERHGEYDFGSYKRGFNIFKNLPYYDEIKSLTFCNDSILFQNHSLEKYFEEQKQYHFYGLTCNNYAFRIRRKDKIICKNPHIQSFFISLSDELFKTKWFNKFITSVKKQKDKNKIIYNYEVGLSVLIKNHGYEIHSYYPGNETLSEPSGYYLNYNSPFEGERLFIKKSASYKYQEINPEKVKLVGNDTAIDKIKIFIQNIFSVQNIYKENGKHKVIRILGLYISFLCASNPEKPENNSHM